MSELDRLAEVVDEALARRDLGGYLVAQCAYGAALDQLEAKVVADAAAEARRGTVHLEIWHRSP